MRPNSFARFAGVSLVLCAICVHAAFGQIRRPINTTPTVTFTISPSQPVVGDTVTFSAKVTSSSGALVSSGTVSFMYRLPNEYAPTAVLVKGTVSNGVATASFSTNDVAPGTYTLQAKYSGAAGKGSSQSANVVLSGQTTTNPSGTALSSCGDLTTSGTYYLSQDVSSTGTCFFIDADNITLNLNSHTIRYGTGGGSSATPGIMLADDWYTGSGYAIAATGTTQKHGGFVVYGGNITSAANAGPRSAAIWVGQSNDVSPAPVIHDTVLTTYTTDSSPIFGTVSTSGWQIYNNTINYASLTTSSRYELWGYAVWLGDQPDAPGTVPDHIYNNKVIGAPQGGIYDDHQNAQITGNDIAWNSLYTNDYGVIDYDAENQTIANNVIHPTSGRGIDVEAANTQVTGNTVTTIELPQNAEYGGCELAGTDGIRVKDNAPDSGNGNGNVTNPTGVIISGNTVTVTAAACQANALRLTSLQPNDTVTFTSNTFISSGGSQNAPDYGVSFDGDVQPVLSFQSNSFESQYAYVNVDWDGANVAISNQQTWNGSPKIFVDNENGYNAQSQGGPTFSQYLSVDSSSGGSIQCGAYAAGPVIVGPSGKTC